MSERTPNEQPDAEADLERRIAETEAGEERGVGRQPDTDAEADLERRIAQVEADQREGR